MPTETQRVQVTHLANKRRIITFPLLSTGTNAWRTVACAGDEVTPREMAAALVQADGTLLLAGGRHTDGACDDLFEATFTADGITWKKLGLCPHVCGGEPILLSSGSLAIFGGTDMNDFSDKTIVRCK